MNEVASQHKLNVSAAGNLIEMKGGSQARMRLKGAWLSQDADLPIRGQIKLDRVDEAYAVSVSLEDTMGFGVMDRKTKEKYERVLDTIMFAVGASFQSTPEAPSGHMAAELERLADLHAQGALSEGEFQAAKNKLLGL